MTLVADGMFVNNTNFLITISPGIKFMTVEDIPSSKDKQLSKKLKITMNFYSRGRMILQTILMDMELDSTNDELMREIVDNTSAAKEHVEKIKRYIIPAKQICRDVASDLLFNCLLKLIVVNLVYLFIIWLDTFPIKNGISQ